MLTEEIKNRLKELNRYLEVINKSYSKTQEHLKIATHNGKTSYYLISEKNDTNGKYISEIDNKEKIIKLARNTYYEKLLKAISKEKKLLESILDLLNKQLLVKSFLKLSPKRKLLVKPIVEPDDLFLQNWDKVIWEKKLSHEEANIYTSQKGVKVKSKSELIIANLLEANNIHYRYEYPFKTCDFATLYPDFTVLNLRTRKVFIWEHFGMMDSETYLESLFFKINKYEESGVLIGKNLIVSFESKQNHINTSLIQKLINAYLK